MADTTLIDAPFTSGEDGERRLATIERVGDIFAIPAADAIVRARIRGWDLVVKVGEFNPGDLCVYIEVDSMLDVTDDRFAFLEPRGVRTDATGRKGHVLKTIRLRGQYSQGLALPVAAFPELGDVDDSRVGEDLTALLGIVKWEPPIPASLAGQVRGMLPGWIRKTDEDRIQNFADILDVRDADWHATEKIDGSSMTAYVDGDDEGVCSRNLDLLPTDGNTLWDLARTLDLHARLRASGLGTKIVIQGEAFGEGIQKNPLRVKGHRFAAFALYADGVEVPRGDWPDWVAELSVPTYDLPFPATLDEALAQVETIKSNVSPDRAAEGVVWRAADRDRVTLPDGRATRASFKVISNRYLVKQGAAD